MASSKQFWGRDAGARSVIECALAPHPGGQGDRARDPRACYINSDCRIAAPKPVALDPEKATWLWLWSEEMSGLLKTSL